MLKLFALVTLGLLALTMVSLAATPRERAEALLKKMTLKEKLSMVHGELLEIPGGYVGGVRKNERLGIPALNLEDGPQGVADEVSGATVTTWPSALTAVSSWDTTLFHEYSAAIAQEQRDKGTNVALSPMMNIARVPMGGRNFESMGEDPHLASQMANASITGIQSRGIMANAKHFLANNIEHRRKHVDEYIDERTLFEIYYPAFEASIRAGVLSVMCSYNLVNGSHACQNAPAIQHLKGDMGFQGFLVSDWLATHSTADSANAGLDMEMPGGLYFGDLLELAILDKHVPEARLDDMVVRILTSMYAIGLFDRAPSGDLKANVTSAAHHALARKVAGAGTTLLTNDGGVLPIGRGVRSIAIVGDDASVKPIIAGGGSGHVNAGYIVTPLEAIRTRASPAVNVTYTPSSASIADVQAAVRGADLAIVFVGTTSAEGSDRKSLSLGDAQDSLIETVAAAQSNSVVVVHCPGAVTMPWKSQVRAILAAFLPGAEDGHAIADVLFGDVDASGRLPLTFPVSELITPIANNTLLYPGVNDRCEYLDKLNVGYRWWLATNREPLFCFGHGLSYTTFSMRLLNASASTVTISVTNTGARPGSAVPQLYLAFPAHAGEPPRVLRAFTKINALASDATHVHSFSLTSRDFSIWDVVSHRWSLVHGSFTVFLCSSSCVTHDSLAIVI